MNRDLVMVSLPTSDSDAWRVEIELTPDELQAIGSVTTQWAFLEHALLINTTIDASKAGIEVPEDARRSSFKRRLAAWRQIVDTHESDDERKDKINRLIGKIANAEDQRHKMTHGLWDWDEEEPEKLSISSFRPSYEYDDKTGLDKLKGLADTLGEINFAMVFPNGPADVVPEPSQHRFLKLGLAEIVPADPGSPSTTRLKPPHRRRPSKE